MVSRRHLLKLSALGTASFAAPLAYSASNTTMTHNTGNPIGSTSPKDLSDNARNLDYLCLGPSPSYLDRNGISRKSWSGIESEHGADQVRRKSEFETDQVLRADQFNQFMDASGYEPPLPYASGVLLTRTTQTVTYQNKEYRVKSAFLPLRMTNWAADLAKLKLIGDDSLRQDLATPEGGGFLGVARSFLAQSITRVSGFFSARSIDPLEYGVLITSRPDENNSGTWDATAAIEAAIVAAQVSKWTKRVSLSCDLGVTRTIVVPKGVEFDCPGGELSAIAGFTPLTAVLQFGNKNAIPVTDGRWAGRANNIQVNCNGQRLIGVDFNLIWGCGHFPTGSVKRCGYIAVKSTAGYGLSLGRWEATAPMLGGVDGFNAGVDSIGYLLNTSDGDHGILNAIGFFCYLKASGNNNSVAGGHPFGLYKNGAGVPQTCPFGIGVLNEGQGNVFSKMIMDSISLIDYAQPASIANGGLAYVNRANGFQAVFDSCKLFQPDRSADGEVSPVGSVIPFSCSQSATYVNCEVVDYNPTVSVTAEHYQGANVGTCNILSRRENRFYSVRQILFNRKAWFPKGLEFQTTPSYQDADERSNVYGACSFAMPNTKYIYINTNYEGTIRVIKLQRWTVAFTVGDLSSIGARLDNSDRGEYRIWYEPTKKLVIWDGTAWRDAMGTLA